jgi:hypothetical protein
MKKQIKFRIKESTKWMAGLVLLAISTSAQANEGGVSTRGGGSPGRIDSTRIKMLLQGDGLKEAMLHYVKTLEAAQIDDPVAQSAFTRMLRGGALQKDILTPKNYVFEVTCRDSYSEVPAATDIGGMGGAICFDVDKLTVAYADLSAEDAMIRLASLAFHEHTHHFQDRSNSPEDIENEAYHVAAYVQITAKVDQVPLLKWSPNGNSEAAAERTFAGKARVTYEFWGLNGAKLALCAVPIVWFWTCVPSDRGGVIGNWGKLRTRHSEASFRLSTRNSGDGKLLARLTTSFTRRGCQPFTKTYVGVENEFHGYDLYSLKSTPALEPDATVGGPVATLSVDGKTATMIWHRAEEGRSSKCSVFIVAETPMELRSIN